MKYTAYDIPDNNNDQLCVALHHPFLCSFKRLTITHVELSLNWKPDKLVVSLPYVVYEILIFFKCIVYVGVRINAYELCITSRLRQSTIILCDVYA